MRENRNSKHANAGSIRLFGFGSLNLFRITFLAFLISQTIGLADHRAALVIANHTYEAADLKLPEPNLKAVVARLEGHGFQCEVQRNLDNNQLKREIEDFAARTPVRGTALVYFIGQALPGEYNGSKTLCLLDIKARPGRGLGVDHVFAQLHAKGGSTRHVVVVDAPQAPAVEVGALPEGSTLVFGDGEAMFKTLGKASVPVSPRTKLIFGRRVGDEWVGPRGMVYCWCPPGRFVMGSPENEPGRFADETQREVTLTEGFWMAKYEWPRALWRGNLHREAVGSHKLHPVNMASLSKDTQAREIRPMNAAAQKLLPTGWEFALPGEDQWEYAARAGASGAWSFGSDAKLLPRHANFADKTAYDTGGIYTNHAHRTLDDGYAGLAPVGSFAPNAWGLHDLHGNVAEWCDNAVMRGGSWVSTPQNCRLAARQKMGDRDQRNYLGVRVVIRKHRPAPKK